MLREDTATMKTVDKKSLAVRTVTVVLLLFSCFYMYDFYKCLSGFIANGFREPLVMLPMILAFLLPVLCFLFFFYDFYIKPVNRAVKTVSSLVFAMYAAADLVLIFARLPLYMSNNSLGVYDALPSVILHFPYDMIIVLSGVLVWQIFKLAVADRAGGRVGAAIDGIRQSGTVHARLWEYIALCFPGIFVFVFTGSAICAVFTAFDNAFYDIRFVYLLLWVMIIPMADLILLVIKPEKMNITKKAKLITLGAAIAANAIFALCFAVFELLTPDFLIHIGKPLFLIAFSVSLPIEPIIIFSIMALSALVFAGRSLRAAKNP